jgi:hypothetical protein
MQLVEQESQLFIERNDALTKVIVVTDKICHSLTIAFN